MDINETFARYYTHFTKISRYYYKGISDDDDLIIIYEQIIIRHQYTDKFKNFNEIQFVSYIRKAIYYKWCDYMRKLYRERRKIEKLCQMKQCENSTDEFEALIEITNAKYTLLVFLDRKIVYKTKNSVAIKQAIVDYVFYSYTIKETAKRHNLNYDTLKKSIYRLKKKTSVDEMLNLIK